jgi:hypothetical protein
MPIAGAAAAWSALPGHLRARRCFLAAAIVLWPLLTVASLFLTRVVTGNGPNPDGAQAVAGYARAAGVALTAKFTLDMVGSFLMLFGFFAMAGLAIRRSPWLATLGGFLAPVGAMTVAAFVALDGMTYEMARLGGGPAMVALWDQYNNGPINDAYTIIFIAGVVLGPILLAVALWRARAVPAWAAVLIVLSRLVLVVGFPLHLDSLYVDAVAYLLLFAASLPVALVQLVAPADDDRGAVKEAERVAR